MCKVCNDLDSLTTLEAVRNICESVDIVGKEHAKEVMETIASREIQKLDDLDNDHDLMMSLKAVEFAVDHLNKILPKNEMLNDEELVEIKKELAEIGEGLAKDLKTK